MNKKTTDCDAQVVAYMKSHFQNVPPTALAAFRRANSSRAAGANSKSPPLRQAVTTAKSQKGSSTVPTATASKPIAKPSLPANYTPPADRTAHMAPRHIVPTLKNFTGPDGPSRAYVAAQAALAAIGRSQGVPNHRAEAFLESKGYGFPMMTATGTEATKGGYTIPDPLAAAVFERKVRVGVSRQLAEMMPMTSDVLGVPKETDGLTVRYVAEAEAITASDLTFGMINLRSHTRCTLSFQSNELNADALISWADLFVSRCGSAMAAKEDDEFINGDGTSTYGGEVGLAGAIGTAGIYTAATGHDTWPELTIADFAGCMGLLPSKFSNGSEAWLCSPQFYATAMLASVNGAFQGVDENGRMLFMGKPVYLSSKAPLTTAAATIACYYGSFSEAAMIGDREPVTLMFSKDYMFGSDLTVVRGRSRYDINIHEGGNGTTAGAYVALKTAS